MVFYLTRSRIHGERTGGSLCVRLFRKQVGAYSKNCKYQRSLPKKILFSSLSLSLSLSQFANGLSPPFSPMFYTRSSLLFIFNRICKNFFNIWIYPDRTEIKIANINARSKKILFPFFSLFSQFTNGLFLYVDILCIFFFYSFSTEYVKLSLTFGYRCGSRSLHSFNLLSVYNPHQRQVKRVLMNSWILRLYCLSHFSTTIFFFYHSLPLRFPLNNSRKIRQGIEEGDNNSSERVTLFRRRTFRKFEREKTIIRNLDKI